MAREPDRLAIHVDRTPMPRVLNFFTKAIGPETNQAMKTIRHTVNLPKQMEPILNNRIQDFRSLSAYFVAHCFADALYLPKRPIAQAFVNASDRQQHTAIENLVSLRNHGWGGVNIQVHFEAVTQVKQVAAKCLKQGDWLLDHLEEELAFLRGEDFRR